MIEEPLEDIADGKCQPEGVDEFVGGDKPWNRLFRSKLDDGGLFRLLAGNIMQK